MLRMVKNRLANRVFEARYMRKRKRRSLRVVIEKRGYRWGEVKPLTEDRKEWKRIWKMIPIAPL